MPEIKKKTIITVVAGVFLIAVILSLVITKHPGKNSPKELVQTQQESTARIKPTPVLRFGLPVDSFQIIDGKVQRNENLSTILLRRNISYSTIDLLARKSKPIFDIRKIREKNAYHFFLNRDSLHTPDYFIYEIDPVNYVTYGLAGDSITVTKSSKPVHTVRKIVAGTIKNSLWDAMINSGANPILTMELSEIYAWTIDFFEISKGDQFKVVYDENYVDSTSVGIGTIYASVFRHRHHSYYAFRFKQDSTYSYYDREGQSLKKAFLKAPLKYTRISSRFTNDRYHPILKIHRPHHGVDYAAPSGTPIHAIGDGVITRKGYQRLGGGNYLYIRHNSIYTTSYMHMRSFARGMAPGTFVKQGQIIGYVGQTGLATGPHLDFRVYKNGKAINPLKMKAPPVKPVAPQHMAAFTQTKDTLQRYIVETDNKVPQPEQALSSK